MASIKKLIAKNFKKQKVLGVGPATITISRRGARSVAELAGGTNPTATTYPCSAMIDSTGKFMDGTLVAANASKLTVFGGTLPDGVRPKPGAVVVFNGITYRVIRVVSDPVEATHECEVTA